MGHQDITLTANALPGDKANTAPGYAWTILGVVFLASVAAPLNQYKVPPMMPVLMETFHVSLTMAGMMMSIFAVTGLILAIPAGIILQKLGSKTTGLIAIGFLVIGAIMGAFSTSAGLMLTSRMIEGVGMGLITVVAPAMIAIWFPAENQGTPMGIWATWVPTGSIIMYNLAPTLGSAMGWQAVWWFGAGFAVVALALFWAFVKMPPAQPDESRKTDPAASAQPALSEGLTNRNIWMLAFTFASFLVITVSLTSFLPVFLSTERGHNLTSASSVVSISMFLTLVGCPFYGWLSDRIGSRKRLMLAAYIVLIVILPFTFMISGWMIPVFMVLLGMISGIVPTMTFASVPEVMGNPQLAGIGMAAAAFGQNLGMFAGPVIFGTLVEMHGWVTASYLLIPFALIGLIVTWRLKVR